MNSKAASKTSRKVCKECNKLKSVTDFPKDRTRTKSRCKPCYANYTFKSKGNSSRIKNYHQKKKKKEVYSAFTVDSKYTYSHHSRELYSDNEDTSFYRMFTPLDLLQEFSSSNSIWNG